MIPAVATGPEPAGLASCSVAEALAQATEASRPRAARALAVVQGAAGNRPKKACHGKDRSTPGELFYLFIVFRQVFRHVGTKNGRKHTTIILSIFPYFIYTSSYTLLPALNINSPSTPLRTQARSGA